MKQGIAKLLLGILILIGILWIIRIIYVDPAYDTKNPLDIEQILVQEYLVNPHSDTILVGREGTLIRISENAFVDSKGKTVENNIRIKLKEIITKQDMVLSGLSTTSNRDMLESGGMIWLKASSEGINISLKEASSLGVMIPADSIIWDMKLFTGKQLQYGLDWQNPVALLNKPDTIIRLEQIAEWDQDELTLLEAIEEGIVLADTLDFTSTTDNSLIEDTAMAAYITDGELYYIFEANNFGWYNIDRFVERNKTSEINMEVNVTNRIVFQDVFVKLIFTDLKSIISGYESSAGQYIFGKSGNTHVQLPLGEEAVVLVTAYHKRKPYYAMQSFTIMENNCIKLKLEETRLELLKARIESEY